MRMKKTLNLIIACTVILGLEACATVSKPSILSCEGTGDTVIIAATNAEKGAEASSSLTVKENTPVRVQSSLTGGAVRIVIQKENTETPAVDSEYEVGTDLEYGLEAGEYTVTATVVKTADGGIIVDASGISASASEDGQNPVMNFIGTYAEGRCSILVEAQGDHDAKFTVNWGSSASEHDVWEMSGTMDPDTLTVAYDNARRTTVVFNEDGSEKSADVKYENGKGSFVFTPDLTLTWQDAEEDAAKDMVFQYAN